MAERLQENDLVRWPRNCERCDGDGEICTMLGEAVDEDEFTLCPDCDGSGMATDG
jgi:DnaJ-class molecular chaperone